MAKAKVIESNVTNIFEETIKAVMVTKRLEEEARKEIPDDVRLRMVQEARKLTRDIKEDEELEAEEERLKKSLRFSAIQVFGIPEDKRAMVENNYEIEKEKAKEVLYTQYKKLEEFTVHLNELNLLLNNVARLEDQASTAGKIEDILAGKVNKLAGRQAFLRPDLSFLTQGSNGNALRKLSAEAVNVNKKLLSNLKGKI
ncbi:hypothetical protein [Planococcus beigongshangi]|uniref:hypothetical protein n=1 Tax=Planococcus beigongshangi TaxID=2782536 RepID=UPI00193C44F7|nr:hypothetical protein [Planococcus beigongshangi]